jgi:acyl-CoA reductase-like NAD-dependent aldehyde dehydrogenase
MDLSQPKLNETRALHAAYLAQRAAYEKDRNPSVTSRRATLEKLEHLLIDNAAAIAETISADFGNRSTHETQLLELFPAVAAIKHARRHVKSWMTPKRSFASIWFLPARTELRPQPLGVVGIIVPWNYPVLLAVGPLIAALAAGNRALIKMSEFTPRTGELFAKLIARYFSAEEICVINGDATIAREFSALPFDHLLFTGSTSVGRHVMKAAAENLTPVTLELGGKSPAIIGPEANLEEAVQKIIFGKCLNAGQTCIAPDYVLLPRGQEAKFIDAAKRAVAAQYPTLAKNTDYTSIINVRHLERLHDYLVDAASKGASIVPISPSNEALDDTQKIAPTVVHGVSDNMRIMQDEIFGPLLPLVPYSSLDEAISYVNAHARPLALYYFGRDRRNIERVLDETIAGGVTVNETLLHISQDHLPFGGVGASGMGSYHGKFGFDTFSKIKPVFHQPKLNGLHLFKSPYGKRFDSLIKILLK